MVAVGPKPIYASSEKWTLSVTNIIIAFTTSTVLFSFYPVLNGLAFHVLRADTMLRMTRPLRPSRKEALAILLLVSFLSFLCEQYGFSGGLITLATVTVATWVLQTWELAENHNRTYWRCFVTDDEFGAIFIVLAIAIRLPIDLCAALLPHEAFDTSEGDGASLKESAGLAHLLGLVPWMEIARMLSLFLLWMIGM